MIAKLWVEIACDGEEVLGDDYDEDLCALEVRVDTRVSMNSIEAGRVGVAMGRAVGYALGIGWTSKPNGAGEINLCPACTKRKEA